MTMKIKYPADRVVHWATGPVNTCEEHGRQLVGMGKFLGTHVAVTKLEKPAECMLLIVKL
ncbi:hypothetical protein LCGC14_3022570 [marine sediment metagenome]|uniref:Uncharacterized protein n=1 Tax=marine sediment metagenome TaxID=412755 RepID=A0A0F8XHV8_9ZZZZ